MGVDYIVWVIPKDRAFKPNPQQISALANALRDGGWVPQPDADAQKSKFMELLPGGGPTDKKACRSEPFQATPFEPGWVAFHSDHELVFEWRVNDAAHSRVQFPFTFVPYPESGHTYFGVRIIVGHEYFYWTGENAMPSLSPIHSAAAASSLLTGLASLAAFHRNAFARNVQSVGVPLMFQKQPPRFCIRSLESAGPW